MPEPLHRDLRAGLETLRDYCTKYFSESLVGKTLPVEFWEIEDDDLYVEVAGFMPLFVAPEAIEAEGVPRGFALAWPIFSLEDDLLVNGYTALQNAGAAGLKRAADCYRTAGLPEEADALLRARVLLLEGSSDDAALEEAYLNGNNPYLDDDRRYEAIACFFCANRELFVIG